MTPDPEFQLSDAQSAVAVAEQQLDAALAILRTASRAEKTMIGRGLRDALDKVDAARAILAALTR